MNNPAGFEEWWKKSGGGIYGKEDPRTAYQTGMDYQLYVARGWSQLQGSRMNNKVGASSRLNP